MTADTQKALEHIATALRREAEALLSVSPLNSTAYTMHAIANVITAAIVRDKHDPDNDD